MRKRKPLIRQIYPSYLLITIIALIAVTWYASGTLKDFYLRQTAADLEMRANLLQQQMLSLLSRLEPDVVDAICKEAGMASNTRITVILPDGIVIGDSRESPRFMDNHANRPEVARALKGEIGRAVRYSKTLDQRMMYVARPLIKDETVEAVIRTAVSVASLDKAIKTIRGKIVLVGLLVAILAAGIGFYVSRLISRPIEQIRKSAERFAAGDLTHRLASPANLEMASLTDALNRMAAQLDDRMKTVVQQRNELEAVLSSMQEGVVAVDAHERIISMNQAAGRMFDCDPPRIQGRDIREVIRNLALQRFVARALASPNDMADDFIFHRGAERILNIRSSPLYDAHNLQIGSLLVLNDVTRLRHLENVRSDFVANVSHEIKTPLTAIKGFVETLQQGDMKNAEERERFLSIILKHVDRLSAILEDLLMLSRMEQETGQKHLRLEVRSINEVIQTAVQVCQPKAEAKEIVIEMAAPSELRAGIDATLLEQALVNLIDNAVKYSDSRSHVLIEAGTISGGEIFIRIKDQGAGISQKHLPRLFERFYRVDKARSRKLGGTGLGLAIVKHVVQAHGGHVTVESTLGKGSTFTIHLPAARS
jgi:two-component system phosphate regulon sensor histidine kinase PhoR